MDITFQKIAFGSPEFDQAIKLRDLVLREPLNLEFYAEDIAAEWSQEHFGLFSSQGHLLAVLTLKYLSDQTVKMRQVAVHPSCQRQGLGKILVEQTEAWCQDTDINRIELNARDIAVRFYESMQYQTEGDEFEEVGIKHWFMSKNLS